MTDQSTRSVRLRYTAIGAFAALAAVGAIAGTAAFGARPPAKPHGRVATAAGAATKTPTSPPPNKTGVPQPPVNHQPFLGAIQRLVNAGTITPTEGQAVDREIVAGRVDTDTLASGGFTPTQLQAIAHALSDTKRALAPAVARREK